MNNNTTKEIWKDIKGYEGRYQVSNHGRVYSFLTNKILKNNPTLKGYESVHLSNGNKQTYFEVHRLVAINFINNPDNLPCVNHMDEVTNNNHISNLEWCTHKYNLHYSYHRKHGRYPNPAKDTKGSEKPRRRLIGESLKTGETIKLPSISSCVEHGFARSCVKDCLNGKQKKHKDYIWKYAD